MGALRHLFGPSRKEVYRKSIFSGIATWLGMQDLTVGDKEFDEDFVIKGTHPGRMRSLFENAGIRELIAAQRDIHLSVKDDEAGSGRSSRRASTSCISWCPV